MATPSSSPEADEAGHPRRREYVVVARRYRPQTFDELVGQEHVAKALSNAISTHRVGHAYLFTGARGVGKTSAARILAKALNCQSGPTATPCNRCDICESISAGEDVDVLEIDGASNRGIDEIRQLRQNVNVRPSRERFKIYIIDEVHMLTREAFNALLKTLEEPPEHVKFVFCTTEPTKIPVTILSRCQRFDFAGIQTAAIAKRLEQIVEAEGVAAQPEALYLLARRAAGSMRDSQSLLEQLLAFAPGRITVADVDAMLGTAGDDRLARLVTDLVAGKAAEALGELDAAVKEGVDPGLLIEQLLGFYRDMMVAAVGCSEELFLHVSGEYGKEVAAASGRVGLESILAAMQILDKSLSRLRYSTQGRILAELALVRIASLGELSDLSEVIAILKSGAALPAEPRLTPLPGPSGEGGDPKKKAELSPPPTQDAIAAGPSPTPTEAVTAVTPENATEIWARAAARVPGLVGEHARHFDRVATAAPNRLVVAFRQEYTFSKSICEAPEQKAKLERALAEVTGQRLQLEFEVAAREPAGGDSSAVPRSNAGGQRRARAAQHPMVQRAIELFGAFPERVDDLASE